MPSLFDPITLGAIEAPNRILMAPLTRTRSTDDHVPTDIMIEYYRQRASAGLIISEATGISPQGLGWPNAPGLWSDAQVEAWKPVTAAVHKAGGRIVAQLWHQGRLARPDVNKLQPLSSSATRAPYHDPEKNPYGEARAATLDEIRQATDEYGQAARNAIAAGFDGVEVHGANGYLVQEFLSPVSNIRDDQYGGSPVNRARFAIEVTRAVAEAVGADRTGIRLSPQHNIQGVLEEDDDDALATYLAVAEGLAPLDLAFVDILSAAPTSELVQRIRRTAGAPLIVNSGFTSPTTRDEAETLVDEGWADAVAAGRPVIANPDLVERWREDAELNEPRPALFYGRTAEGYTDYPSLEAVRADA